MAALGFDGTEQGAIPIKGMSQDQMVADPKKTGPLKRADPESIQNFNLRV